MKERVEFASPRVGAVERECARVSEGEIHCVSVCASARAKATCPVCLVFLFLGFLVPTLRSGVAVLSDFDFRRNRECMVQCRVSTC